MKLYVVTCQMEGCNECNDEYHVIGVFDTKQKGQEAAKDHEVKNSYDNIRKGLAQHLHSIHTNVEECYINKIKEK